MSSQYRISNNLLGEGSYSKVYLGFDKKTHKKVAIKIVDLAISPEGTLQLLKQEIQLLMKLRDQEGFVRVMDSFKDDKRRFYIIFELLHGTLYDLMKFRRILSDLEAKSIFRQVADRVRALHQQNIVHRDVKLENIGVHQQRYRYVSKTKIFNKVIQPFTDTDQIFVFTYRESLLLTEYKIKLGDFGFAKEMSSPDEKLTEYCGTLSYAAPEVIKIRYQTIINLRIFHHLPPPLIIWW